MKKNGFSTIKKNISSPILRLKRSFDIKKQKNNSHFKYTIISAAYNVEKYLDAYFKSLINQSISFQNNIKLIIVDDGSTDTTPDIIKKWAKDYPNIEYYKKENGGQATARNYGLQFAGTEWVTFIDPDDFLHNNYFWHVDNFLWKYRNKQLVLLSCNFVFFNEGTGKAVNNHPLKYRFLKDETITPSDNMGGYIQLSVNSSFFKTDILRKTELEFDEKVRPSFEDAKFVNSYLCVAPKGNVGFDSKPRYYYRKRSDGTSTLDKSWQDKRTFFNVLKNGVLETLELSKNVYGFVPRHIQRVALYHLYWFFKKCIGNGHISSFLDDFEKENVHILLHNIFNYIDYETILSFELCDYWFFHKIGLVENFKERNIHFQIAYIQDLNLKNMEVTIRTFMSENTPVIVSFNNQAIEQKSQKIIFHDLLGKRFLIEKKIKISLIDSNHIHFTGKMSVKIGDIETKLSVKGLSADAIDIKTIINKFPRQKLSLLVVKYIGSWLFIDRDTNADDNAEHLYRYVKENHPDKKIYFILRSDSLDWNRLEKEGFNLLAFGSDNHKEALRACSSIISSQIDNYVVNFFNDNSLQSKNIIFLQHGVTKDDLSSWLNTKKIDLFVTATKPEYNSIVEDGSPYSFFKSQVCLSGFPRHDALIAGAQKKATNKYILIMPTWRNSLIGGIAGVGNERTYLDGFSDSNFYHGWTGFFKSEELKTLVEHHNYKIMFFPHVNLQLYLDELDLPDYFDVRKNGDCSIQSMLQECSLLITDYSSIAFEAAIINKPIIYFQFDENDFFSGSHTVAKGYFNYRNDGFGPVVTNREELLQELAKLMDNDMIMDAKYKQRIAETFIYRDGKACERVFNEILRIE